MLEAWPINKTVLVTADTCYTIHVATAVDVGSVSIRTYRLNIMTKVANHGGNHE